MPSNTASARRRRRLEKANEKYLKHQMYRMNGVLVSNYAISLLKLSQYSSPDASIVHHRCRVGVFNVLLEDAGEQDESLTTREHETLCFLRGVTYLKRHCPRKARDAFRLSGSLATTLIATGTMGDIDAVMNVIPQLLPVPERQGRSTVVSLDLERAFLRRLGYRHALLEDNLLQKEGWSFDSVSYTEVQRPTSRATLGRMEQMAARIEKAKNG